MLLRETCICLECELTVGSGEGRGGEGERGERGSELTLDVIGYKFMQCDGGGFVESLFLTKVSLF